jgi:hypothetical protein
VSAESAVSEKKNRIEFHEFVYFIVGNKNVGFKRDSEGLCAEQPLDLFIKEKGTSQRFSVWYEKTVTREEG